MGNKKHFLLNQMKDKTNKKKVNFIVLLVQNTVQMWKKNNDSKNNTLAYFQQ